MTLGRQLTNPTCSLKKPAECLSLVHIIRVKCQAFCFSASKYANKYQAKPLGYKVSQFAELMISTQNSAQRVCGESLVFPQREPLSLLNKSFSKRDNVHTILSALFSCSVYLVICQRNLELNVNGLELVIS